MASTINLQLSDQLRRYVDLRTSDDDVYSTPSEYLRDLIRRDMAQYQKSFDHEVADMLMKSTKSKMTPMPENYFEKKRKALKKITAKKA
jgi:Arc/MetJ-type ribon-helix-helix transcriptional regulator